MGRYYYGDIEGKFWFAIQDSDDADCFGVEGVELYENYEGDESQDELFDDPYALSYTFLKENIGDIDRGIQGCLEMLGDYKEKLDAFFSEGGKGYETYSHELLISETGCSKDDVTPLLTNYARLELGQKIKKCVEETGQCCFDAEL